MTDSPERYGTYDPFEDTGDWPFRDAPPPEEPREREDPFAADSPAQLVTTPAGTEESAVEEAVVEAPAVEPPPVEPEAEAALAAPDAEVAQEIAEPMSDEDEDVEGDEEEDEETFDDEGEEELGEEGEHEEEDELAPVDELVVEEIAEEDELEPVAEPAVAEHAAGLLAIPDGVDVLTGAPHGFRRSVAVVVSRFNGEITTPMLEHALAALRECHVADDAITVVPVPGAFELPLTALALAKTRRFACVVALGCIVRGETPHFDVIAGEAASGLQLAAIETGIPVSFGVLTCDTREQAEARVERGADAARTALEMADLFSHVRTRAAQA